MIDFDALPKLLACLNRNDRDKPNPTLQMESIAVIAEIAHYGRDRHKRALMNADALPAIIQFLAICKQLECINAALETVGR